MNNPSKILVDETDIVTERHESQNTEDNSHHGKENSEIDVKSVNSLMVVEL